MSGIIKATNLEVTTIKDKTNTNTAISIDTSGRVNIPKVPAFAVRGFGSIQNAATVNGFTVSAGTDIIYNWTSIDINRDNAFNNSTGIYTVPVAGLYQIQAGFGYKSSSNYMALAIFATSSDHNENGFVKTWANNDNNHTGRQLSTIVEATVGQEFALGMSDTYSTPSTAGIYYLWFSAYMVG
jgi:hypothetical protein